MKIVQLLALLNIASVVSVLQIHLYKVKVCPSKPVEAKPLPRIYGGIEAEEGQFPYMIFTMLRMPGGRMAHCSASLIKPATVLLAAHCVAPLHQPTKSVIAVGGKANIGDYINARQKLSFESDIDETAYGLQERRPKTVTWHPNYDDSTAFHDLGLITLNNPFSSSAISVIPLSRVKMRWTTPCTALGWGLLRGNINSHQLHYINKVNVYTSYGGCYFRSVEPFLCLHSGPSGICQGDSGGPLVCNGMVWGVASHGISRQFQSDCGDFEEEYYSETFVDLDWIEKGGSQPFATDLKISLVCAISSLWNLNKF